MDTNLLTILAVSDAVWTGLIAGVVTLGMAWIAAINNRKLDAISKVGNDTHTLVNSNMGVQLNLNSVVSRRLALTTKDPEDIAAADLSDKLLKEHNAKQAIVDSK